MNSMEQTREFLKSIGMPEGDAYNFPTSEKKFADGGQYRFEVPGIQGPKVMRALLEAMDSYGIYLHRVTQTQGIMRLTDEEIIGMVELAKQYQTDLILAIGPRATTDTSASVHTENPKSTGGFIRHYEVPEMIRIAASIYLKIGGSVAATHSWDTTEADARKRAKQVSLVKRMIDEYYPEAIQSPKGSLE